MNKTEEEWDKNLTKILKERLESKGPLYDKYEDFNKLLHGKRIEYCETNTARINEDKYICNICTKMFKAPNFVHNHIFNKHMSMIQENVDKDVRIKLY